MTCCVSRLEAFYIPFLLVSLRSGCQSKWWDHHSLDNVSPRPVASRLTGAGLEILPVCKALTRVWECREVRLFDLGSGKLIQSLAEPSAGAGAAGDRSRCYRDAATFSPGDDMLLWGNTLLDPRTPRAIHRFDQFTDFSGGCFHPAGAVRPTQRSANYFGKLGSV